MRWLELLLKCMFVEVGITARLRGHCDPLKEGLQMLQHHPERLLSGEQIRSLRSSATETLRRGVVFTELLGWLAAHAKAALGASRLSFATSTQQLRDLYVAVSTSSSALAEQYVVFKLRALFPLGEVVEKAARNSFQQKQTMQNFSLFAEALKNYHQQELNPYLLDLT